VRTACDIEGGERWATKSALIVPHFCLPCSDRALLHIAMCIGPDSNILASSMVFVFELEAITYMQGCVGSLRALVQLKLKFR
jgi:hypothetical protein